MPSFSSRKVAPASISANADWTRALKRTADIAPHSTRTLWEIISTRAQGHGDREALVGAHVTLTYRELAARAEVYASWGRRQCLRKGDRVALLLESQPDYIAIWIGLASIGVVIALLNTHLVGGSLAHCLDLSEARHIITSPCFIDRLEETEHQGRVWLYGANHEDYARVDVALDAMLEAAEHPKITLGDIALLIYTSGTTGLPKAAQVTHLRVVMWSEWFAGVIAADPNDRLYNCLPMYHSVGGIVAVGAMLVSGGTVIVRDKFSAAKFWSDVVDTRATIFQYIGELCRYLVLAPASAAEQAHSLRLCIGNGLRADIWEILLTRFKIPRIIEFYAATEGSFSLFNLEGRVGAIGRIPRFMTHRSPVALVRFDHQAQRPVRGKDGFCLRCEIGEIGEAIGLIIAGSQSVATRFEGYTGAAETEAKLLRNVFIANDSWFRTGDLMRQDSDGFFYFVDRVGDTFRWKGENVATTEVEAVLTSCTGIQDAAVFGIPVPRTDGRAGMAVLITTSEFDLTAFRNHIKTKLASFAQPVFLRFTRKLCTTSTFKFLKQDLLREGFDPEQVKDILFVKCPASGHYQRLDARTYAAICRGDFRL